MQEQLQEPLLSLLQMILFMMLHLMKQLGYPFLQLVVVVLQANQAVTITITDNESAPTLTPHH